MMISGFPACQFETQRCRSSLRSARRIQSTGMSVAIFDEEGDYGAVIVSGSIQFSGEADVNAAHELLSRTTLLVLQNEIPDAANVVGARALSRPVAVFCSMLPPAELSPSTFQPLIDILVVNAIEAEMLAGVLWLRHSKALWRLHESWRKSTQK